MTSVFLYSQEFVDQQKENNMFSKEVTVSNEVGLHARPATFFIQKANEFKSEITVVRNEKRANAKSLLGVLSLGITCGSTIVIEAIGIDAEDAVNTLSELINSDFNLVK